jgi:hypothetical protein
MHPRYTYQTCLPYKRTLRIRGESKTSVLHSKSTAPAIQLLLEVLWDVARDLCTHGKLSFEAEASLQHYSPLLHKFLEPYLTSTAVPDDVISFADSLRKVGGCT